MSIQVKDIFYSYNIKASNVSFALKGVSFEIETNSFVAVIGHTGSGKTTLMQCLNALLVPQKGEIDINGIVVNYKNRKKKNTKLIKKHVGLVFQFPEYQLFEETIEKDVAFGVKNFGATEEEALTRAHEALFSVGLDESYFQRSPFDLSGGERRKVALAGIIALHPEILILDEPTVGLDPKSSNEIMALVEKIKQNGSTVILVTHNMDLVNQYADKVILLEEGEITFFGNSSDLFLSHCDDTCIEVPKLFQLCNLLIKKGYPLDLNKIKTTDDLIKQISSRRNTHA